MGIFNQHLIIINHTQKENEVLLALKDLLVLRVSLDLLALKVLLVPLALKVLLVHQALVLISHQMGIMI